MPDVHKLIIAAHGNDVADFYDADKMKWIRAWLILLISSDCTPPLNITRNTNNPLKVICFDQFSERFQIQIVEIKI